MSAGAAGQGQVNLNRIHIAAVIVLSAWLTLTPCMWFAATRSFRTVDRVLAEAAPGFEHAVKPMGADQTRAVLRYFASEINATLFEAYSATQLILGVVLVLLLLKAVPLSTAALVLAGVMLALVLFLALVIQPGIASLGREIAFGSPSPSIISRFWALHGAFTALDSIKLLAGLALLGHQIGVRKGRYPAV